jgi:predicted transcriptional regulator
MEWSNEKVLELIDAYRDFPVLWDCSLPDYKNRNKRSDALIQIALLLGTEKVEVERKIKNLLSHFSREVKREKQSVKSGGGRDSVYKSKWFAYENMMFLMDRNKPRNTSDTQVSLFNDISSIT